MAEKYLYMYHELNELDYIIIRPSTPFGPFQNYLGSQGAVTIFMYRVSKNLPITLWGDGKIIRDYFYVSNLIDAIIKCTDYETYGDKRIFNVGGGIGISINQLIYKIESTVNNKAIIIKNNARKFDPKSVVLDTTLIHNELGWIPKVSLDEGLNKTWHWLSKL